MYNIDMDLFCIVGNCVVFVMVLLLMGIDDLFIFNRDGFNYFSMSKLLYICKIIYKIIFSV